MTGRGRSGPWLEGGTLVDQLAREPFRFEFFEAVRRMALAGAERQHAIVSPRTGVAWEPYEEHISFRAHIGHAFPASAVRSFAVSPPDAAGTLLGEMTVTFMALAGTGGILPGHYTQLLIDRVREKDFGLRDFLDLFNHRLIAHFYQGWAKCHFFVGYESAQRRKLPEPDAFTRMLLGLVGLGTPGVRNRQAVADDVLLYFAGHFSHRPRSAVALERIVREMFRVPTEIRQFQGQWMSLRQADQTRLRAGSHNCLGRTAIAGRRVWGIENKFRVRLGPVRDADFKTFLPGQPGHIAVSQVVRSFVGPAFDFDLQVVLSKEDVPPCQLGGSAQLGWNTWLFSRPAAADVSDAVFACGGWPTH